MKEILFQLNKASKKALTKVPYYVAIKLEGWIEEVLNIGLENVRKIPGYHDEPLKGKWKGYRSIRLTKAYRAIYQLTDKGEIVVIEIVEVNKHEY
jgi:proteic killer suppression protein